VYVTQRTDVREGGAIAEVQRMYVTQRTDVREGVAPAKF
jgi:hypothetical protein